MYEHTFWQSVLISWCSFSHIFPMTVLEVLRQFLWLNYYICIDNKPIFYEKLYRKGCKLMSDLYVNNELLDFESFCVKYPNAVNWLEYQSLIDVIPHRWKRIVRLGVEEHKHYVHPYDELIKLNGSKSKIIYLKLTQNPLAMMDSYNSWNHT